MSVTATADAVPTIRINDTTTKSNKHKTLDVTYIDDNFVISHAEVWTYFRIPGDPLNIPTPDKLGDLAESTQKALSRFTNLEFHYYASTHAFDTSRWLQEVLDNQRQYEEGYGVTSAPFFSKAMRRQAEYMHKKRFKDHSFYLGVRIKTRKAESDIEIHKGDSFFKKVTKNARRFFANQTGGVDPTPSPAELARYVNTANEIRSAFSRNKYLKARPLTMEESFEMIFRAAAPGMPVDPREAVGTRVQWGNQSMLNILPAQVDNADPTMLTFTRRNPRYKAEYEQFKADQAEYLKDPTASVPVAPEPTYKTHAITLAIEMPGYHKEDAAEEGVYKSWALDSRQLENSPAVDISVRFKVYSHREAKKRAEAARTRITTNLQEQSQAGVAGGGTTETYDKFERADALAQEIATGRAAAQITMTGRMVVHNSDAQELRYDAETIREHFLENHRINLIEKDGQHLTFWEETLPAQRVKPTFRRHEADIDVFTNGLPFTTTHVGYPHDGFFFGTLGAKPFLFDPTRAARLGRAPAIVSNGSLGGGKTVGTLMMVDCFRLMGCYGIILDPKHDMKSLLAFKGRGHTRLWSLTKDGKPGSLDPFNIFSVEVNTDDPETATYELAYAKWKEETRQVVDDTLNSALAGYHMSSGHSAVLAELVTLVMDEEKPSMHKLLGYLREGKLGREELTETLNMNPEQITQRRTLATEIYAWLHSYTETQLGKLIFGERTEEFSLMIEGVKTTIVDLSGLSLPGMDAHGSPKAPSSPTERISVTLFSLVTAFARKSLENPAIKGARYMAVDEFSQIRGTQAMQTLTSRFNRMGRSLNIIPMYIDQSTASSVGDEAFNNSTGTRFVFRSSETEAEKVAESIDRPGDQNVVMTVPNSEAAPGIAFVVTPPDDHPRSREISREKSMGQVRLDYGWYTPEEQEYFETNDNPAGKEKGWVRAAYRKYPLNEHSVLIDPYSTEEVDTSVSLDTSTSEPLNTQEAQAAQAEHSYTTDPVAPITNTTDDDEFWDEDE